MTTDRSAFNKISPLFWVATLATLLLAGRINFLFFHVVVELFSIIVACGIFSISWHSRRLHENGFFIFLGISALSVASIDLLHTLTYQGMGILPQSGAPVATQLWIGGRLLQAVSMVLAFFFINRRLRVTPLVAGFMAVTALIFATIFFRKIFPVCYSDASGLTHFKIVSEYFIILLFAVALSLLRWKWQSFDRHVAQLLAASIGFFMVSELAFTSYVNVFSAVNQVGHICKVLGFYCLYRGVIVMSLTRPYDLIFRQLKEVNRTLTERVCKEVAKNREKDAMLVQQDRQAAMGEMTANIAHQWRQPLNAISLLAQDLSLHGEMGTLTGAQLSESVSRIVDLTKHMSQTINDFSDFYRPDNKKIPFSIWEGITKSLKLAEGSFLEHCISVTVEGEEDITIPGYPNQFAQVILNLLSNSREALVERNIANPTIGIEISRKGERTVITIRDNAGGIPPEIIERIFDPYFTTKKNGTGIGLYMSRNIVEQNMAGKITVRNDEEGAIFTLHL